jgi:hypothetical protein
MSLLPALTLPSWTNWGPPRCSGLPHHHHQQQHQEQLLEEGEESVRKEEEEEVFAGFF